jgi:hypothetical protein
MYLFFNNVKGTALYFTMAVKKQVEEELANPLTLNGFIATIGQQSANFGIGLWVSAGAIGACLVTFLIYLGTTCCGTYADRAKYRQSVYY